MTTVTILRSLWRRRIYVVGALVLALLAATVVKFKVPSLDSRRYDVGVATAHILVDTPSSQVVNIAPRGSDTTAGRASLMASLMVEGDIQNTIAKEAGLRPDQLSGVTGAAIDPGAGPAATPAPSTSKYVINTQVLTNTTGDTLPIIEVDTQAPTAAAAARLANAAITGLGIYLNSKAALEKIPDADRLDVTGMGAPQATLEAHGPSNVMVLLVFFIVFVLGCTGILSIQALVRGWRSASRSERGADVSRASLKQDDADPGPPHRVTLGLDEDGDSAMDVEEDLLLWASLGMPNGTDSGRRTVRAEQ
jgi:hypothetical protein